MTQQERYEMMYDEIVDLKNEIKHKADLINRQKAEIERLKTQFRYLDIECERLEKENESLNEKVDFVGTLDNIRLQIKAEARKEFAEMLKAKTKKRIGDIYGARIYVADIDNLLKEFEKK